MEFREVIESRRSVRRYQRRPVSERKLRRLWRALQVAPTAANRQPFSFVFVRDPKVRARIAREAAHQEFVGEAPVLVVAVCEPGRSFDAAIALDHMILAATDEGLGTCWVGWLEREPIKRILGIPAELEVPVLVTVGHPAEHPEPRPRKPLNELIMLDRYGRGLGRKGSK